MPVMHIWQAYFFVKNFVQKYFLARYMPNDKCSRIAA